MENKEKKYIDKKINKIRDIVSGSIIGANFYPSKDDEGINRRVDATTLLIHKEIKDIYKYAKKHYKLNKND